MTTALSNDTKTGLPRQLNSTIQNLIISYSTDLMNTDGTVFFAGKIGSFQLNPTVNNSDTAEVKTAKAALTDAVGAAFEQYINSVGV